MPEEPRLDWSTAEVSDGSLTVGLSEKPPKRWREAFERTATLLGAGSREVALDAKRATVRVAPVRAGDEERVRQLVEGAVLEANAKRFGGRERSERPVDEGDGQRDEDAASPSPDERLTEHFRGFADRADAERRSPAGGE